MTRDNLIEANTRRIKELRREIAIVRKLSPGKVYLLKNVFNNNKSGKTSFLVKVCRFHSNSIAFYVLASEEPFDDFLILYYPHIPDPVKVVSKDLPKYLGWNCTKWFEKEIKVA